MDNFIATFAILFMCTAYSRGDAEFRVPPNTVDFFPNIKGNLTSITWAHAVNDKEYLDEVLKGAIMMIEADVVMGTLIDDPTQTLQPIMGHPPSIVSDISLQQFLHTINEANLLPAATMKGVKLDFKSIEVFEESLEIIDELYKKVQYPLWINADILTGPILSTGLPVNAARFLEACKKYPAAMLSIGWTTRYGGLLRNGSYTDTQIARMLDTVRESGVQNLVTYPVRAGLAANSLPQMTELLRTTGLQSTLTVWSSQGDYVDIAKLRALILDAGLNRVYLDVPEEVSSQLHL